MNTTLTVKGMHCNSCKVLITEALEDAGAKDVNITLNTTSQVGKVQLNGLSKETAAKIIKEQGDYTVE